MGHSVTTASVRRLLVIYWDSLLAINRHGLFCDHSVCEASFVHILRSFYSPLTDMGYSVTTASVGRLSFTYWESFAITDRPKSVCDFKALGRLWITCLWILYVSSKDMSHSVISASLRHSFISTDLMWKIFEMDCFKVRRHRLHWSFISAIQYKPCCLHPTDLICLLNCVKLTTFVIE